MNRAKKADKTAKPKKANRPGKLLDRFQRYYRRKSIQFTLSLTFTIASVVCMLAMGILLYSQFAESLRYTAIQDNQQVVNQMALNVTSYTRNMMRISDSMYYSVIKNADISDEGIDKEMNLLYEANSDYLLSIACFTAEGDLVAATPVNTLKKGVHPTDQEWFTRATSVIENQHFSAPHVQNLFDDSSPQYSWAVSLSRMVELTEGGTTRRGVLVVDMKYSGIEQIFTHMTADTGGYVYLVDKDGEIIYHPQQKLIYSGLLNENNAAIPGYDDGIHEETFEGAGRQVIVKTLSYTGWRLVSVIPNSTFAVSTGQMRLFAVSIIGFAIILIIILNSIVSSRVAGPIKKLDRSVKALEKGVLTQDIYIGGPHEIAYLGRTVRSVVAQMRSLMDDIVHEQETKRKHEFDALQAQINPHFLYNTLDSIVWMIESGKYPEAISMVTALANLFRISLSRGNDSIPIQTELQHARHYLHIQNIRYKNKFRVEVNVAPEVERYSTIKLIIQPLLENAIYHAMEYKDGDGLITINGYLEGADVILEVRDNGLGMTQETVDSLLSAERPAKSKGSGIGLRNVHQRIQLFYGPEYGLSILSELDEGTTIRVRLPQTVDGNTPVGNTPAVGAAAALAPDNSSTAPAAATGSLTAGNAATEESSTATGAAATDPAPGSKPTQGEETP